MLQLFDITTCEASAMWIATSVRGQPSLNPSIKKYPAMINPLEKFLSRLKLTIQFHLVFFGKCMAKIVLAEHTFFWSVPENEILRDFTCGSNQYNT